MWATFCSFRIIFLRTPLVKTVNIFVWINLSSLVQTHPSWVQINTPFSWTSSFFLILISIFSIHTTSLFWGWYPSPTARTSSAWSTHPPFSCTLTSPPSWFIKVPYCAIFIFPLFIKRTSSLSRTVPTSSSWTFTHVASLTFSLFWLI